MSDSTERASVLDVGRRAVDRGRWHEALEHLGSLPADQRGHPEVLRLRGVAAYGAGDLERAVGAFEDLHALHRDRGEPLDAARAAATVAMYLMMDTGLMAPVRAWLTRADRLLRDAAPEDDQPGPGDQPAPRHASADAGDGDEPARDAVSVRALVAMVRTYERFLCGDTDAARQWSTRSIELGEAGGYPPAVALGRTAAARLAILRGEVEDGLEGLDEVAAMLLTGSLDSLTTGMVWCELVCAVRGLALHDRAEQWTAAMEEWSRDNAFGGINGRCRVHRAEVLRLRGAHDRAEQEARAACEELAPWMRRELGWPLTELGEVRLRRGDLEGAEEAFLAAHGKAWDPQPGLARLRLAQGRAEVAAAMITTALERPLDVPFKERPPFGGVSRAPLLEAQVEIAIATGDTTTARAAADELQDVAAVFASPALRAAADVARGRVALAEEDADTAATSLTTAVTTWLEVGAPYEAAVARVLLGDAHDGLGNAPSAELEWRSACDEFDRLEARLWSERVRTRLDGSAQEATAAAVGGAPSEQPDAAHLFRCDGDVRRITFDGETVLLRDLKGMRYLARLLAEPDREFHVLDLVAAEEGAAPTARAGGAVTPDDVDAVTRGGDAGVVLDDQALAAYRRRLADVEDDIEEATRRHDDERRALAESDREFLVTELARATGIGGRQRRAHAASERARSSVTRTLRYAIARIAEHHATLGEHLEQTVETGTYCAYRPDPRLRVEWAV